MGDHSVKNVGRRRGGKGAAFVLLGLASALAFAGAVFVVGQINLLDNDYMPYTQINNATFPADNLDLTKKLPAPGTKEYGVLSILIGHVAGVERLLALPPGAFRPPPKVRSAVVRLRFHPPEPAPRDIALFRAMVQAIFTRRRKTIANALAAFPPSEVLAPVKALTEAGLEAGKRPEHLTISELVRLSDVFCVARGQEHTHRPTTDLK